MSEQALPSSVPETATNTVCGMESAPVERNPLGAWTCSTTAAGKKILEQLTAQGLLILEAHGTCMVGWTEVGQKIRRLQTKAVEHVDQVVWLREMVNGLSSLESALGVVR